MSKQLSNVVERFLRYVSYDTQSQAGASCAPSTKKQLVLSELLAKELEELGASDIRMDEAGNVYGCVPANCEGAPVIGYIAHLDTSPDVSGANVKPRIVENYDGKDLVLNEEKNIVMHTAVFEHMLNYVGQDMIVTDGTTLMGCDDKCGCAEIMNLVEYLKDHPDVKHGAIKVAFTVDEEVGCNGARVLDLDFMGCDFAYTLDGQTVGEINAETFNAAFAYVTVHGLQTHPGRAKNKMLNAITIGMQFNNMIPESQSCERSEGREGYYHLSNFDGGVTTTKMKYLIRDFDMDGFNNRKVFLQNIADYLNGVYGAGTVDIEFEDTYFSMYEVIKTRLEIIEHMKQAITDCGVTPRIIPIRGGTDGSIISGRGLACPNLSTGYQNGHSIYEYATVQAIDKSAEILIKLATSFVD
ncbi:MAG: peptidase T [Candidatus Heteroscillospira sp.]|jgi:tripeptide aminopeptidase